MVAAGALLLLWGHIALPDVARFALFLCCLAGAALAMLRLQANARPVATLAHVDPAPVRPDIVLDDDLMSLEAELHTLVDQYRTDCPGATLPR